MPEKAVAAGQRRYDEYWARQMADPEFHAVYQEEAAKKELWLQLVHARQAAGFTQAEIASPLLMPRNTEGMENTERGSGSHGTCS